MIFHHDISAVLEFRSSFKESQGVRLEVDRLLIRMPYAKEISIKMPNASDSVPARALRVSFC